MSKQAENRTWIWMMGRLLATSLNPASIWEVDWQLVLSAKYFYLLNMFFYRLCTTLCKIAIKSKHLNHFYIYCTILWRKLRNGRKKFLQLCPFLRIAFEKMRLSKMHQIKKLRCPSRQLFIKITFVFMKIFDFLVKIAIFGAFLFRSRDLCHALLPKTNAWSQQ